VVGGSTPWPFRYGTCGVFALTCIQPSDRDKGLPAPMAKAAIDQPQIYFRSVLLLSGDGALCPPARTSPPGWSRRIRVPSRLFSLSALGRRFKRPQHMDPAAWIRLREDSTHDLAHSSLLRAMRRASSNVQQPLFDTSRACTCAPRYSVTCIAMPAYQGILPCHLAVLGHILPVRLHFTVASFTTTRPQSICRTTTHYSLGL
jgi:hypothetical protein